MLARRWLPGNTAHAIETKQAEFRAQPNIPIGRLRHREDSSRGKPVPGSPRGMPVLANIQRGIERQEGRSPEQQAQRAYRKECQTSLHVQTRTSLRAILPVAIRLSDARKGT